MDVGGKKKALTLMWLLLQLNSEKDEGNNSGFKNDLAAIPRVV